MNPESNRKSITLALGLVALLNIEGIIKSLISQDLDSGFLNPYLGPLVLGILAITYFHRSFSSHLVHRASKVNKVLVFAILASFVMLGFGLKTGEAVKLGRDLVYLWIVVLTYLNLKAYSIDETINVGLAVKTLIIANIVVLPVLAILVSREASTRFSSFMISEPLFAIATYLAVALAFYCRLSPKWLIPTTLLSSTWIFLSGTRTALSLMFMLVMFHLFFAGDSKANLWKKALLFTPICLLIPIYSDVILNYISNAEGVRVLSFSDMEYGSLNTRISWYTTLFEMLVNEGPMGGFGAGASETYIGKLTHFDFLRYWYDYSVFYVIAFLLLELRIFVSLRVHGVSLLLSLIFVLLTASSLLLLSMHNVFQSPGCTVLLTIALYFSFYGFHSGKGSLNTFSESARLNRS